MDKIASHLTQKGKSCLWNKQYGKIRNLVRKEWWGRPSEQDFKKRGM